MSLNLYQKFRQSSFNFLLNYQCYNIYRSFSTKQRIYMNDNLPHHIDKVRVIMSNGENKGILATNKALELAKSLNLDLVLLNEKAKVCKILDGKEFLRNILLKEKLVDKKKKQNLKEKTIRIKPVIANNDKQRKLKDIEKFLSKGIKVKVQVWSVITKKGRWSPEVYEQMRQDAKNHAQNFLLQFVKDIDENIGIIDNTNTIKNMYLKIRPTGTLK